MCIAIACPAGVKLPSEAYLKMSFENNPDGAGFAFNENNKTHIVKGLMTWDKFIKTLKEYDSTHNFTEKGVLIHFRIQTTGGIHPECCHPFPISDNEDHLHATEFESDYAVIHNGVIDLTKTAANAQNKMSDTMVFIKNYLFKLASNYNWFENDANMELIYNMINSKMAIMNNVGEIIMTQGFTLETDGCYYSNNTYKELRPRKTQTSSYNSTTHTKSEIPCVDLNVHSSTIKCSRPQICGRTYLMKLSTCKFIGADGISYEYNQSGHQFFIGSDGKGYISASKNVTIMTPNPVISTLPEVSENLYSLGYVTPYEKEGVEMSFVASHIIKNEYLKFDLC